MNDYERRRAERVAAMEKAKQLALAKERLASVLGMWAITKRYTPVGPGRRLWTAGWAETQRRARDARRRMNMEDSK